MIAPKVAVPMPSSVKPPSVSLKLPAPSTSATATVMRFFGSEKSTRFSTQIRPAAAAIKPNTTIDKPPSTGTGMVWMSAPNFGEKPGRVDARHRHHAHVLGIGRDPGAAERARHHSRDAVADEGAAEQRIEVA